MLPILLTGALVSFIAWRILPAEYEAEGGQGFVVGFATTWIVNVFMPVGAEHAGWALAGILARFGVYVVVQFVWPGTLALHVVLTVVACTAAFLSWQLLQWIRFDWSIWRNSMAS